MHIFIYACSYVDTFCTGRFQPPVSCGIVFSSRDICNVAEMKADWRSWGRQLNLVMARLWLKDWLPLNPVVNHGLSLYCFTQIAIWRACKPCYGKPMQVLGNDSTFQLGNHMFSHLNWRKNGDTSDKSRFQAHHGSIAGDIRWYMVIYLYLPHKKWKKNYDGWLWTSMILASKTTHWCRQSFEAIFGARSSRKSLRDPKSPDGR